MVFQRSQNETLVHQGRRAFTLIELLVVISIIALLLSILLPSLRAVKKQAQSTICKTNLKQWGICYLMYTEDWDGKFPEFIYPQGIFMESLRDYFDDVDKLRVCPSANKASTVNPTGVEPLSFFGSTFKVWQVDPDAIWLDDDDWGLGSYTENGWIRNWFDPNKEWRRLDAVKTTSQVPLLLDGRWPDSHVESDVPAVPTPREERAFYNISNWSSIRTYMMRRHKDGINGVIADMSVTYIKAEDLWSYKWHKEFETQRGVNLDWLDEGL